MDGVKTAVKTIAPVLGGTVATSMVMISFEGLSHILYPKLNEDTKLEDIPAGALLTVLAGSVFGAMTGGYIVGKLAPSNPMIHAVILGTLFTGGQYANLKNIRHPRWYWLPGMLAFMPPILLMARYALPPTNIKRHC